VNDESTTMTSQVSKGGSVLRVAVAGLGAVGMTVARRLDEGLPGLRLAAVSARDRERAAQKLAAFRASVPVEPLERLPEVADVVVECLPSAVFREVAEATIRARRVLVVVSGGCLLAHPDLVELARERGSKVIVPTGALLGLDAVQAAAQGTIDSVRMVTRKPPGGLAGAPHLIQQGIDLADLGGKAVKVFEGPAREAVRGFPANVNVAAALSMAGIGADRTTIEIWADPAVDRNMHTIYVESDSARFQMEINNIPSDENPKTGRITALSVIAAIRKLGAPLVIGT